MSTNRTPGIDRDTPQPPGETPHDVDVRATRWPNPEEGGFVPPQAPPDDEVATELGVGGDGALDAPEVETAADEVDTPEVEPAADEVDAPHELTPDEQWALEKAEARWERDGGAVPPPEDE